MLSRVDDPRVFESSEDVIIRPSSRRYSRHQQLNGGQNQLRSHKADEQIEIEEDEQLHPQHPYRMRKRVLQQEYESFRDLEEHGDQISAPSRQQERTRPMEFVFLSSGEIRAREDCPPGLELPKLQQNTDTKPYSRLEYPTNDFFSEEEEEMEYQNQNKTRTPSRQQVGRQPVARQHNERFTSSSSSSSRSSESSVSEDADVSSDNESLASQMSEEIEQRLKNLQVQSRRQAYRNTNRHSKNLERSARKSVRNTPRRSLKLDHLCSEDDDVSASEHSTHRSASTRLDKSPSSDTTRESRQRPAPLEQLSKAPHLEEVQIPTRRVKRSPKMEVSHLNSSEKGKVAVSTREEEKVSDPLESELQKEKKRVLEKMTQLLDEQRKNQQLRDRIDALETQLTAKDNETSNKLQEVERERETQLQSIEKQQADGINALEEQVRLQETSIIRLKQDKEQLKAALKQLKKTTSNSTTEQNLDGSEATNSKKELEDMTRLLQEFLAVVERWKQTTKKELQHCEDMSQLPALVKQKWLEFPQLPEVSTRPQRDITSALSEQQLTPGTEEADAVVFLKKRLRQREEELRQTHVKFGELKEICARQCVREADLQNFINEHRLRGNLVIRKNSSDVKQHEVNNQEPVQEELPDERRNGKLKMISSRGTNTPAPYEDQFVNDEYSDNQGDNDYDREEVEYPVRTPKVYVQVGRDGVYDHVSSTDSAVAQKLAADRKQGKRKTQQRVERIRLVPSPSLAQRYERVPTPTTTTRRKKNTQHLSQSSSRPHVLGECPPGCGSRPSFMNRKTATRAQVKTTKRSVSTSTSRGAVGVVRPWM